MRAGRPSARIAREVGFSEGAIYRHFKSKKDILSLLADHIEESMLADITAGGAAGRTALETLDFVLRGHLSATERRRGISFQVIAEIISFGDKKLNRKAADTIDKYVGHVKGLLEEGVRRGEVKPDVDLDAAAMVIFGMIQGLVNLWALKSYSFDPVRQYEPLWKVFVESLVRRPLAGPSHIR